MPANEATLLIVDVATNGFSPEKGTILEVACILISASTLDVIDAGSWVVAHAPGSITAPDFHEALLAECMSGADGIASMKATDGFLYAGQWATADIICNRALDFDMLFMNKHLPLFAKALTKGKQHLELKALDLLHRARGGDPYVNPLPRTYRAGDDAIAALEELQHIWLGGAPVLAYPSTVADHDEYFS